MKKMFLVSILTMSQIALSAESLSTKVHNQYQSLRAMGMGNAFTTISDDYSAVMYNPAALARKKRGEIQVSLLGATASTKIAKMTKDITDAEKGATGDAAKINAISAVLDQYYGKPLGLRLQAAEIFWVRPNWGVAILPIDLSLDLSVNKQFLPALDVNAKKDSTVAFGYGQQIIENVYMGTTVKAIHRASVEQTIPVAELATNSNVLSKDRFKEGMSIDFDLGFLWTPAFAKNSKTKTEEVKIEPPEETTKSPENKSTSETTSEQKPEEKKSEEEQKRQVQSETESNDKTATDTTSAEPATTPVPEDVKITAEEDKKTEEKIVKSETEESIEDVKSPLTVSFVVRNVLSPEYSKTKILNKSATTAPSKNPRVYDIGMGYNVAEWGDLTMRLTAELKNLDHPFITSNKSTHAGFEFDYSPGSWFEAQFRAGLNQMYYTAGATLLLGVLEIDLVTYGEEVGTTSTKIENRVYGAKLGFNF